MDLTPELINAHTVIIGRTTLICSHCNEMLSEDALKDTNAHCPDCHSKLIYVALTFWQGDESYGEALAPMRSRFPDLIFIGWADGRHGEYTIVDGLILAPSEAAELVSADAGRS